MARASEEGDSEGFGWFDADIVRFRVADTLRYKVPHIGWNAATIKKESRLMNGIADRAEFYFVNSYHMRLADNADLLSESDYEAPFVSALRDPKPGPGSARPGRARCWYRDGIGRGDLPGGDPGFGR